MAIMEEPLWIFIKEKRFKRVRENYLVSEDETMVCFNGYFYRWNGEYYTGRSPKFNKFSSLHRALWSFYKGEIPPDKVLHHIDGNGKNNSLENLELVCPKEHLSRHSLLPGSWSQSQACKDGLRLQNEKAKEWHRSEEGRAWHREQAKISLPGVRGLRYPKVCEVCRKDYEGKTLLQKFCSNACKTRDRILKRWDFRDRPCCICGTLFNCNKYALKKTCSEKCKTISMLKTRKKYQDSNGP
jgi:hypothetical protein